MTREEAMTVGLVGERAGIVRGRVIGVEEDGRVLVEADAGNGTLLSCERLLVSKRDENLTLDPGESVLVWMAQGEAGRGVILGKIGRGRDVLSVGGESGESGVPEELVLEARDGLTLKCGECSITLRRDGKVLIRGKDLVSRADGLNRIKGGAVSIN